MPSPRYFELIEQYKDMHGRGQGVFSGTSVLRQLPAIKVLIKATDSRTMLDYGSGKGQAYQQGLVREGLGLERIDCFDPAWPEHEKRPEGEYDGVVCCDVLEHIPEEDVDFVIGELFGFARKFVFANVALYPANKVLPNGENAHCTLRPESWWRGKFEELSKEGVMWSLKAERKEDTVAGLPL